MVQKQYILALDEGTTSARAILFDRRGEAVCTAQREIAQYYPQPGWVEQDPTEIYATQYSVLGEVMAKSGVAAAQIAAVGITNQRETVVVWDAEDGRPVCPAIVWQCRRTAGMCEQLRAQGVEPTIRERTGLRLDAYFSATKLQWILEHVEGARSRAEAGRLRFGTVDSWLIWRLTGGRAHVTDVTNASRTMLFNIHTMEWDEELLRLFDIPRSMLPEVRPSSDLFAEIALPDGSVPIAGIAGDQQAALFGQGCFRVGEVKNTYGTGCFLLMNCGHTPPCSRTGLLTTVAATCRGEAPSYALEGSVFAGGDVIRWLRDELGFISESQDSEYFASKVSDSGGVYVVPAFAGLGAPYWDMYARGTIVGLTRGSGRNQIIRAALESIAYQSDDLLRAVAADAQVPLRELRVDGGASQNSLLMQFQADISGVDVLRSPSGEATARGAAFLAGLAVGYWRDRDELTALLGGQTRFTPAMTEERRAALRRGWERAMQCASGFARP